jgi:hypothetical protein
VSKDTDFNYFQLPFSDLDYDGLDCDPRTKFLNPSAFDDLLKISAKQNVTVRYFKATSDGTHREDAVDLNNLCQAVTLMDGTVTAGAKGVAVTIKGGSCATRLVRLVIDRPGKYCDIEIGNHSDQSWKSCDGTVIEDCLRRDSQPVRVAWGRGKRPQIIGGHVKIVWWWTAVLHAYVYAKHYLKFIP